MSEQEDRSVSCEMDTSDGESQSDLNCCYTMDASGEAQPLDAAAVEECCCCCCC